MARHIYVDEQGRQYEDPAAYAASQQQDRQGGGMSPMQTYDIIQNIWGGEGGSGGSSGFFGGSGGSGGSSGGGGGAGGAGMAGAAYIIAAIIGQMIATNNTDTVVDGVETGNVFSRNDEGNWRPHFFTEPWLAWAHDKAGWEPTAGEELDAALVNNDWGEALKRLPAGANYWANPIGSWLGYDTWRNMVGDDAAIAIDPIGGLMRKLFD